MLVNFADLTKEDQEKLLQQAREIVEEENIRKDAASVYRMKAKELVDNHLKEICKKLLIRHTPEITKLKREYVSMANYLFKQRYIKPGMTYHHSCITTPEQWTHYVEVHEAVRDLMINYGK